MSEDFFEPGHTYKVELAGATDLLMQMHRALPLLLAVAKAVEDTFQNHTHREGSVDVCFACRADSRLLHAMQALDAAHPEWRAWSP